MAGKIKKDWKFWLNIVTFVALGVLVIVSRHQIAEAFRSFAKLNYLWLFMMVPLQLLNNFAYAKLYQSNLRNLGEKVKTSTLFLTSFELNFVNHVFPSGGVSGFSYLNLRLRQSGIPTAKTTLVQILRFALTFVSFLVILFFGMIFLTFGRYTSPFIILLCSSIVFLTIFGTLVGVYIIGDSGRIKTFVSFLPRILNRVGRRFRKHRTNIVDINKVEKTMEDLHQDYVLISKDWRQLKQPFLWALVVNLTDLATVFVVYLAFGTWVNPGAVIIAYAVANFAGLVAILPGGVGIYEGLMTATMASAGVNKGLALSATLVYRVFYMLLFLPPGYLLYQRFLKQSGEELAPASTIAPGIEAPPKHEIEPEDITHHTTEAHHTAYPPGRAPEEHHETDQPYHPHEEDRHQHRDHEPEGHEHASHADAD
jgi:uncharacterized protein (TIRG00374 family)